MASVAHEGDLVIGVTPFGEPNARLTVALSRAGGLGVLDLGAGGRQALDALERTRSWVGEGRFGVRVAAGCRLAPGDLVVPPTGASPGAAGVDTRPVDTDPRAAGVHGPHTVVLCGDAPWAVEDVAGRHRVLVEVTSADEALDAIATGAHGLIARGNESGGRVGELSTFVLVQRLLADPEVTVPVWACGGIGPHTAAAAVVAGAAGVVLDSQLALLAECGLPEERVAAIRSMDGSETVVAGGHRVLRRRVSAPGTRPLPVGQDGFLAARFAERWRDTARTVRGITDAIRHAGTVVVPDPGAASQADGVLRPDPALGPDPALRPGAMLRPGAALRPGAVLRPGSPMTRTTGTRLPLAQGPMTRVSDQAGFASAVADGGALPFIALALAGRDQARTLLEEAGAALAGRPWGVGVLGFAPEEIRNAQLEAVREVRPSHAVIAGGRPSQAMALEREGITTFLHVPSPGLLGQFLRAGARRFVFEGSECGGHVGPRNSFPLWEAQLGVIEDFLDATDGASGANGAADANDADDTDDADDTGQEHRIEVFFAGGIHDERSAAMVAALAAPLTRRGGAVGLLMGTAYLFTEEAVTRGAVQPLFQRQVVAARRTALLETAPGHATRCVVSPYADSFHTVREELRERGTPDRRMWEELERLNVGRLRIASKGVERDPGGALVAVGEDRQLTEGMFMAGDVAVLRSAITTVDALHRSVSSAAADFLDRSTAALRERLGTGAHQRTVEPAPPPLDIAVIGMACMFPQAPDLATFWAHVVGGVDAVTEVPAERWDPAVHYGAAEDGATNSRWGGFLPRIPFDPLRYGIPPAALGSIEPVQLLALEAARQALEDAGYGDGSGRAFDRSRTSVVFGAESGSDLSHAQTLRAVLPSYFGEVPPGVAEQLPALTEDGFPGMLANVIAGRIANRLDLGGANYTVDAACASSLAAVDVACKELVGGTSDTVLCGGADLHNSITDYMLFSSVHALSPTGRSRTFDSDADGIVLGEGVACLVLKRLADAERDDDRVYGVIKGVGSSSDGRSLGLTAPRPEGQRAALERAYRNARVSPADVGLIEAHGTGTVVGDRTELTVLTEVFGAAGARPGGCALGSVKSQIGHTKCAAGLAGLIKTVLGLHTGVKPPTLHLKRPNSAWDKDSSPFAFPADARPWAAPAAERTAGVSGFGFGGTNFHVVVAAHDGGAPPPQGLSTWPAELFVFRGADQAAALRAVAETLRLATAGDTATGPWRLRDLALAASRRSDAGHAPVRVAVVAEDVAGLTARLRRVLAGEHDPAAGIHVSGTPEAGGPLAGAPEADGSEYGGRTGKVAFLFPGQGSQRPGIFAAHFIAFPELQRHLELGRTHADVLYPPAAFDTAGRAAQRAALTDTRVAQPALGMTGLAAYDLLTTAGVRPDMAGGHSYGELVALCAAGALTPRALLELSAERAAAIVAAAGDTPGTMAAVTAPAEEVVRVLRDSGLHERVVLANHNAPRQAVVSGPEEAVAKAVRALRDAGHSAKTIPVACAFHSPLVADASSRFAGALARRELAPPEFPVWANRTAAPHGAAPDTIRAELAAQIGAPVRFMEQIEAMYAAGARVFVEAGPGTVLTRLVGAILGDRPHRAVACDGAREATGIGGLPGFLDALAQLAVAGLPVRTGWLFHGRDAVDAGRADPPRRAGWTVDGQLVRTAAGELLPGALAPARRVVEATVSQAEHTEGARGDRDALISEFLRTSREMVAAQRDVLLTYFGATPDARPTAPDAVHARVPTPVSAPVTASASVDTPVPVAAPPEQPRPAPPADGPAPAQEHTVAEVLRAVSEIIGERTGYPLDMIEPDLDLEADLSIDSIKRAEIAGELARRLGISGPGALGDEELEELAKARTATAVATWLTARLSPAATEPATAEPVEAAPATGASGEPAPVPGAPVAEAAPATATGSAPRRFLLRPVPLAVPDTVGTAPALLSGTRFALLGAADDVAGALSARLTEYGAEVVVFDAGHLLAEGDGRMDGVILLDPLSGSGAPVLPAAFPVVRAALRCRPRWLLAARHADPLDLRPAGLHGLFRTVAKEYPQVATAVVDFPTDGTATAAAVADALLDEVAATDRTPVVLRTATGRQGLEAVETGPGALAAAGAGPAGEGAAEAAALGLDRDAVVVLVGGGRGITARFAAALAAASRCRIELLGRTPEPVGPEDPATAGARDEPALRAALAALGGDRTPATIQREAARILALREVAATVEELRSLGSRVRYRSVDVRDAGAVLRAVKEIHTDHGRLDGVVYAAGVIDDHLIEEKSTESFQRVFGTKTDGASTLLDALDKVSAEPSFAVLFGSVSAVSGNRGQADYAAANDALEAIGTRWAARTGRRVLTVHWGPWAPTGAHHGMVTPELARAYARRGIALIDPEEGALALLRELAWGDESTRAVVRTASRW
ncbi:SDR family oxidoreductase [Streptomyces sp. NA02950]|uniref:type I polyketide synthase n=1 Tax=Streptomyces sp. NA02950 TaxID=2742137 RepID=UPI0015904368|nr:type I polyketide synthase [Streptomyces sp. NA02950]QKV96300.1 SDR family oxidoreductase [Streptomyces sp. NA02950]